VTKEDEIPSILRLKKMRSLLFWD